jgi:hypothetical protein
LRFAHDVVFKGFSKEKCLAILAVGHAASRTVSGAKSNRAESMT